jgi:hypothetical protein
MKAIVRISVTTAPTATSVLPCTDYHAMMVNIKGRGKNDIYNKVDLLNSQFQLDTGEWNTRVTILWNKEFEGLGFIKHSINNGFTGESSTCVAQLEAFSALY